MALTLELLGVLWLTMSFLYLLFPCSLMLCDPICIHFHCSLDKSRSLICFFPVSSCITTYKKTPPPVPPRTTTKPFISITAQSSTESAQDAYMDGHGQRGDIISQSGLSNSTESLDSMKALTAAIEAANAQIHGPASQHVGNNTATVTTTTTIATVAVEDRKKDHFKKNRCLSIGIQVQYSTWIIACHCFGSLHLVYCLLCNVLCIFLVFLTGTYVEIAAA